MIDLNRRASVIFIDSLNATSGPCSYNYNHEAHEYKGVAHDKVRKSVDVMNFSWLSKELENDFLREVERRANICLSENEYYNKYDLVAHRFIVAVVSTAAEFRAVT